MPFTIRAARPDELDALGQLLIGVYANVPGFPGRDVEPAYYELLARVGEFADRTDTQVLVAARDDDDALLGGVVYFSAMTSYGAGVAPDTAGTSSFRLLAVATEARGLGVGRALVDRCLALAQQRGHEQVLIHTNEHMKLAWAMYERMGFVRAPELDFVVGELPIYGLRLALQRSDGRTAR